jgi:hypothetical protein
MNDKLIDLLRIRKIGFKQAKLDPIDKKIKQLKFA